MPPRLLLKLFMVLSFLKLIAMRRLVRPHQDFARQSELCNDELFSSLSPQFDLVCRRSVEQFHPAVMVVALLFHSIMPLSVGRVDWSFSGIIKLGMPLVTLLLWCGVK